MTDRIYENNSYIKEFRAQVVACLPAGEAFSGWQDGEKGDWAVVLDQTAFFPRGRRPECGHGAPVLRRPEYGYRPPGRKEEREPGPGRKRTGRPGEGVWRL